MPDDWFDPSSFSEVNQIRGVTGEVPLENTLPAKKLKIGILNVSLYHRFIGEVIKLFQDEQGHH